MEHPPFPASRAHEIYLHPSPTTTERAASAGLESSLQRGWQSSPRDDNTKHSTCKTRALEMAQEGHRDSSEQLGGSFWRRQTTNWTLLRHSQKWSLPKGTSASDPLILYENVSWALSALPWRLLRLRDLTQGQGKASTPALRKPGSQRNHPLPARPPPSRPQCTPLCSWWPPVRSETSRVKQF